jgi:Immunity protein 74
MILEITLGHIRFKFGERTGTIYGEMLFPHNSGEADYVVYENTLQRWDPPSDNELIDKETKDKILEGLRLELARQNGVLKVETLNRGKGTHGTGAG